MTARPQVELPELLPIERDESMERDYIPLPGGWEVQTKGNGSTFRICNTKSGDRMPMTGYKLEHEWIEQMAREIHAAWSKLATRLAEYEARAEGDAKDNEKL